MNNTILSADSLSCERDHRLLFCDLNLELRHQDLVELRGANGSGKTTLLRCLAGLSQDYLGSIKVQQRPLYIGHKGGLNPLLTPYENLAWYVSLTSALAPNRQVILSALAEVGLAGYEDVSCQYMSAGQQRRTILARLLLPSKALWLLDEPLTALDNAGVELVRSLISRHALAGGCAIYATHRSLAINSATNLTLG